MNEILRARQLRADILLKAASIRRDMHDVNTTLGRMQLVEEQHAKLKATVPPPPAITLVDLPTDLQSAIVAHLADCRHVVILSQACRQLRTLVNEDAPGWAARCVQDWGILNADPTTVTRLLATASPVRRSSDGASSPASSTSDACASPSGACDAGDEGGWSGQPSPSGRVRFAPPPAHDQWRAIYRDRAQSWRLSLQMLRWLHQHNAPSRVSGFLHRQQLNAALQSLGLCTAHNHDLPRRRQVVAESGIPSLLSLLQNEAAAVQEGALKVLANLAQGDDVDARTKLLVGSHTGKLLSDLLDDTCDGGVVLHAARTLLNMWAPPDCPGVMLLTTTGQSALPALAEGQWELLELSLRGEVMTRVPLQLFFDPATGNVSGSGTEAATDLDGGGEPRGCTVTGRIDIGGPTGAWLLERRLVNSEHTMVYKGRGDRHGAWGVYTSKRANGSAASFIISHAKAPRVFRLFRVT